MVSDPIYVVVCWSAQQLRGELFAQCQVLEERADAEGAHFRVRGERKDIDALRERIGLAMRALA